MKVFIPYGGTKVAASRVLEIQMHWAMVRTDLRIKRAQQKIKAQLDAVFAPEPSEQREYCSEAKAPQEYCCEHKARAMRHKERTTCGD